MPELRALSGAGQLKKLKADKPRLLIAVCGCMVEQEHRRRQLFTSYPYVDFLFGTDRLHLLPELLERAGREKKRFAVTASQPGGDFGVISEGLPVHRASAYRAWLAGDVRLQQLLQLLRRALRPRPRAQPGHRDRSARGARLD